uniref:Small nuclear RNA activating complex polypeptide 4 n=1 Tax=Leptobrachium leishanense TaxID=445787 RepID=A0A8C5N106_9ANUR
MAAIDIRAQREKIQREIEALEKSLGPSVASIDVVSGSSLDSDEDDLETEDDSDGDLQKNDKELEEGSDKTEMCLQMNQLYQAVIEEKIREVELLIAQNKEQQDEILWQVAGHRVQKLSDSKSSLFLYIGRFLKPYFKDKVTGLGPPSNQDMQERSQQGIKSFESLHHRKWNSEARKQLRSAVLSDSWQRMLQPKILKLEYLQTKMESASGINKTILDKQIQETEREIDDINHLPEDVFIGKTTDEHDWEKISNVNFDAVHSAEKLKKIWQNSEHPHISKKAWEDDEVSEMLEIAAKHNHVNWQVIAQELGTNRTGFQCLQKYQLTNKDFRRKEFTKKEDEMLTDLVQQMRVGNHIPYRRISYFMEGRDPMQLLIRWSKTLDPSLKRGYWSSAEDKLLNKAVAKYGEKEWYKIQGEVPGRSDVQCRERYMKVLRGDVRKGKWTAAEEKKLRELIEKHGVGCWSKLASEFPSRNGAQCLSKWKILSGYYKQRRRRRRSREYVDSDDTFSSSEDSKDSETESSEEETKAIPKTTKSNNYRICNIDLWVPRHDCLDIAKKSKRPRSNGQACNVTGQKKIKEGSLRFNTILKGIAYPHSTDTVTENVDEFLSEADETGRDILHIREETVLNILRKNSKLLHGKTVHRTETKLPNSSVAPERQTEEVSTAPDSMQPCRNTIDRKLLLAVTPWVGNVFLPLSTSFGRPRKNTTRADILGEKLCAVTLTSTPVFTFFIQLFQINAEGCLQIIRDRKSAQANVHRKVKASTTQQSRLVASKAPMSPQSSLVRALNEINPSAQQVKSSAPVAIKPSRYFKKPKTVCELLREKRMRETQVQRPVRLAPAPPRSGIPGQPGTIHLSAGTIGPGQVLRLPLASSPSQTRMWPVMPTASGGLPPLTIPRLPTVVRGAMVANASMPITWVVTPQGLLPLQVKALNVAAPSVAQVPVTIRTEAGKTIILPPIKTEVEDDGYGCATASPALHTDSGDKGPPGPASTAHLFSSKSVPGSNLVCISPSPPVTATTGTSPLVTAPCPSPVSSNLNVQSPEARIPLDFSPRTNSAVALARIHPADNTETTATASTAMPAAPQTPPRGSDKSAVDLSLVALDDQVEVKEWLKGVGGVEIPSLKSSMAYLPPSACTLRTLSRLLLQKSSLEESAFRLLSPSEGEEQRSPSEKMESVDHIVTQKLGDNPAFLTFKQRFLSAFTFPAFLANLPPGQVKTTMDICKEDASYSTDSDVNDDEINGEDLEDNSRGTSSKADLPEAAAPDAAGWVRAFIFFGCFKHIAIGSFPDLFPARAAPR